MSRCGRAALLLYSCGARAGFSHMPHAHTHTQTHAYTHARAQADLPALVDKIGALCSCVAGPAGAASGYLAFGSSMD